MLRLTNRGFLVLFLSLSFLVFSLLSMDLLMLSLSISLAFVMGIDFLYFHSLINRDKCLCIECRDTQKIWVWEEKRSSVKIRCRRFSRIIAKPDWISLESVVSSKDTVSINFRTSFDVYGDYRLWFDVERRSAAGLFRYIEHIDTETHFIVYPETMYWILRVMAFLGLYGRGFLEPSENIGLLLTDFGEYVSSREYLPGDSLRRIDWKKTARREILYVKEFSVGGGLSSALLIDTKCLGKYTCDRVASAMLSTALTISREDLRETIIFCDIVGSKCFVFGDARELLMHVLNKVFELNIVEYNRLYEFVEPSAINILRSFLRDLRKNPVSKDQFDTLSESRSLYIASTLMHDTEKILRIIEKTRSSGGQCVVMTPSRPWLDAKDIFDAYAIYKTYNNVINALRSIGAQVIEFDKRGVVKR